MMDSLRKTLQAYDQQHLLQFWNELNDEEKHILEEDLSELDFAEITSSYKKSISSANVKQRMLDDQIQPIPSDRISSVESTSAKVLRQYEEAGLQEIANGCVAVLLMAGGQGTRLGVNYAKGMYDVGLPSHKTLFQLQAERIRRLQNMAKERFSHKNGKITWYIMTSEATDDMTIKYLSKNNYFGLNKENVVTFKQGMLPCFTFEGKVILDEKYRVSKAPDGNGGLYKALKMQGILSDMKKRGIRSIHAHSVDNILIKVADPIFIGYCLSSSADCAVKVIEKTLPTEPIGVVCKVNETFQVVEYSEITKETSELRDNNGKLVYNAGNICNHYFSIGFLDSIVNDHEKELELHVARKKIPYVDNNDGNRIIPTKPNGIKVEKFVFDVFEFSKNFLIWKDIREREFSPLKNSDSAGVDCPTTARNDLLKLHKKWLIEAGAKEVNNEVEVSPLLSYGGENLNLVANGQVFHGPCVLE